MKNILEVKDLNKYFGKHHVLKDINFEVAKQDFFIITGPSGCGKSTLLNIIGMLDTYDSGSIKIFDQNIPKPFSRKAEKLLKNKIGYLFQNFALVENETVKYNLEIIMDGQKKTKIKKIQEALKQVKLEGYEDKKIYECSGGQQQRIALARLLIKPCELILADEPTGSLDPQTKEEIINILLELNRDGKTIVMVTHDEQLLKYATKRLEL
ncbi:ABC transporter ATP-binding protein [uncultured Thomasclavelia sp.]|uniref:ABC transporter ATP-binding protein n=1 Tax=uncultured Thomasclavelia sp. TaxID=3025759 RepID=UPI0025E5435C|nr:ATP-binding cassette domain-containing protein [uncultured Thomasclavelia sp.]